MRAALDRLGDAVHRRPWWLLAPLGVSFIVLLVALAREQWYPSGDMAQAELHVRGFLRHPPLVGAAGRIGSLDVQGSHPGPSLWVILYPTYLLFGRSSFGMMAGMVVLHMAAIGGSLWTALRVGGRSLALLVVAAVAVVVRASGAHFFVEPWNPWAAVLPFLWFVLLIAGTVAGHRWMFVGAVIVGSHCVQSHVGYVMIVTALCALGLGVMVYDASRKSGTSAPGQPTVGKVIGIGAAAFVVMWLPPVLDQIRRTPGNFSIIWREFASPDDPPIGWWRAMTAFAGEVNVFGDWIRGPGHVSAEAPNWFGFFLTVALFAAGATLATRLHDTLAVRVHLAVGVAWFVGIASISRIFGEFYPYVIRWLWMLAVLGIVVPLWSIGRWLRTRLPDHTPRSVALLAFATVLVASSWAGWGFARADPPSLRDSRLVGGVLADVVPRLDRDGRYLVRWHDPASLGGVGYGVILELERQGYTAGVDLWGAAAALPHRVMPEQTASAVLWVVTGDEAVAGFRARDDTVELGFHDQRTPGEVVESNRLRAALEARLTELGQADLIGVLDTQYGLAPFVIGDAPVPDDVRVIAAELNALRLPIAVFSVPPFSPLYQPGT